MKASTQRTLPQGWQWKKFGDCAQFINGRAYSQHELLDSGTPVLRIQNLNGGDRWYYSNLNLPEDKYCEAGDLLYAWSASFGPYRFSGPKSIFHYHIWRVIPGAEFDKDFTFHLLEEITAEVKSAAHGVAMLHMTKGGIEAWPIPLPPLAEQRRIAEVLDRAEALRAKRRAALAELDSLTQSLFLDLFGDPRANERQWPIYRIESFISDMRGGAALEPDDFVDSGFPILHKGAIKANGVIGIDAKKKTFATHVYAAACPKNIVNREFVAVTLRDLVPAGPSIGFTADLRNGPFDEYLLAQGAYGFRINKAMVLPEYLVHLSNNENFRHVLRQNAVGSTQIHIRTPVYLAIRLPLPPIALQQEFARRVGAVEKLKQAQRAALAEQDALFATLQHRAFRRSESRL